MSEDFHVRLNFYSFTICLFKLLLLLLEWGSNDVLLLLFVQQNNISSPPLSASSGYFRISTNMIFSTHHNSLQLTQQIVARARNTWCLKYLKSQIEQRRHRTLARLLHVSFTFNFWTSSRAKSAKLASIDRYFVLRLLLITFHQIHSIVFHRLQARVGKFNF